MFRSYVEMLVSTALDPDMIQALEDTDGEQIKDTVIVCSPGQICWVQISHSNRSSSVFGGAELCCPTRSGMLCK